MAADGIVPVFSDAAHQHQTRPGTGHSPRPERQRTPRSVSLAAASDAEPDDRQAGWWAHLWSPTILQDSEDLEHPNSAERDVCAGPAHSCDESHEKPQSDQACGQTCVQGRPDSAWAADAPPSTPSHIGAIPIGPRACTCAAGGLALAGGPETVPDMATNSPRIPHAVLRADQVSHAAQAEHLTEVTAVGPRTSPTRPQVTPLPNLALLDPAPPRNVSARDTGPARCSSARLDPSGRVRDAQLFTLADFGPHTRVRVTVAGKAIEVFPDPDGDSTLDASGRLVLSAGIRRRLGWAVRESIAIRVHSDGHMELRSLLALFEGDK